MALLPVFFLIFAACSEKETTETSIEIIALDEQTNEFMPNEKIAVLLFDEYRQDRFGREYFSNLTTDTVFTNAEGGSSYRITGENRRKYFRTILTKRNWTYPFNLRFKKEYFKPLAEGVRNFDYAVAARAGHLKVIFQDNPAQQTDSIVLRLTLSLKEVEVLEEEFRLSRLDTIFTKACDTAYVSKFIFRLYSNGVLSEHQYVFDPVFPETRETTVPY